MAVQGFLKHRVHYVLTSETELAIHLESAYDAFRAHCKRIDYQGEVVDLKALRRMVSENRAQGGFVVDEGRKVCFAGKALRRRAMVIDLSKSTVISADDFPASADDSGGESFTGRYGWQDAS